MPRRSGRTAERPWPVENGLVLAVKKDWPKIKGRVKAILDSYESTKNGYCSVQLSVLVSKKPLRRSYRVCILMLTQAELDWVSILEEIQDYLDTTCDHLTSHMLAWGCWEFAPYDGFETTSDSIIVQDYEQQPREASPAQTRFALD